MREHKYMLIQNGMIVASVESVDDEWAKKEIEHYRLMYSQDGECEVVKKEKKA